MKRIIPNTEGMSDLRDPKRHNWPLNAATIRPLLDIQPGHHLPYHGTVPVLIGNTEVYILGYDEVRRMNNKSAKPHRIRAICRHCGTETPFGRLAQHQKGAYCKTYQMKAEAENAEKPECSG